MQMEMDIRVILESRMPYGDPSRDGILTGRMLTLATQVNKNRLQCFYR